jgi:stalled ribosome alternative rescue factor ArfA
MTNKPNNLAIRKDIHEDTVYTVLQDAESQKVAPERSILVKLGHNPKAEETIKYDVSTDQIEILNEEDAILCREHARNARMVNYGRIFRGQPQIPNEAMPIGLQDIKDLMEDFRQRNEQKRRARGTVINRKFEHKKVNFSELEEQYASELDIEKLNEQGKDGWEFMLIDSGMVYFKREI